MASKDDLYAHFTSSNSLPETIAKALALPAQLATAKDDSEAVEASLHKLWKLVLAAADQTPPEQQAYLVEIVKSLKNIEDGGECIVWGQTYEWNDLPLLGPEMREKWNQSDKDDAAWININAFAARLTAADVSDFSLYGIWTLREALEDPEDSKLAADSQPIMLKAAAMWIEYAADSLRTLSREGKTFDGKMAKPGKSLADKEWRGYCLERWQEWTRRLDKVALEKADLSPVLNKTLAQLKME